jgi:1-acyl-sn-glycerol-3-phosphate acyltransferase
VNLEAELRALFARTRLRPSGASARPERAGPFDTEWARSLPARLARRAIQQLALEPILRAELDLSVAGADALERLAPPAIFVANHSSHLDAPVVLRALPERWRDRTAVAAAGDYFFDRRWIGFATALAFNTYPVGRSGPRDGVPGLSRKLLAEGWSLLVFPEASRSADGVLGKLQPGVARLSIDASVPVVPVGISGAYAAMPRGRSWPAPGRPPVAVRFGTPLRTNTGEPTAAFLRRIRAALATVLDEERTSWWNSLRPAEPREPTAAPGARWRRIWDSTAPPSRT